MSDIDILIKKTELLMVHNKLNQLGFTASFSAKTITGFQDTPASKYLNSISYIKEGSLRISLNLHWHLVNSIFPLYLYTNIDIEKVWQESRLIKDEKMLIMSPDHLLISLAEHSFRHCFNRLILLVDIA